MIEGDGQIKMTPLQQMAVNDLITSGYNTEISNGNTLALNKPDDFKSNVMQLITGTDKPGYMSADNAYQVSINDLTQSYAKGLMNGQPSSGLGGSPTSPNITPNLALDGGEKALA